MKILQRYLARTILSATLFIGFLFMGLEGFIYFIGEFSSIGKGHYGVGEALLYSIFIIPTLFYQLFPVIVLIGSLFGLGRLANQNELMVMRASGFSMLQFVFSLLKVAFLLMIVVSLIGEFVAPKAKQWAHHYKMLALTEGKTLPTSNGIWLRDNRNYLHINTILSEKKIKGITRYELTDDYRLQAVYYAAFGDYRDQQWYMKGVTKTIFHEDKVITQHEKTPVWPLSMKPELLKIMQIEPDEMPVQQLHQYIQQQTAQHTDAAKYKLAFWQRITQPLSTIVMLLLALPFVMGSLRVMSMGARLLIGVSFGFGFYIFNQFFGPLSIVYQWPPIYAAFIPTVLFFIVAIGMLRKV